LLAQDERSESWETGRAQRVPAGTGVLRITAPLFACQSYRSSWAKNEWPLPGLRDRLEEEHTVMRWSAKKPKLQSELQREQEVLTELGDRCLQDDNQLLARNCYEAARSLCPHSPLPYLRLGTLAARDGDHVEAQQCFEKVQNLDPNCAEAYCGLGMIHQQRREYSAAFEMYLKCLDRDLDNLVALLGLFQTSCQMGTFGKIIHFLEIYLAKHPDDVSVIFCLASLYVKEGDLSRAQAFLRRVLAMEPDKVEARELLERVESDLALARPHYADRRQELTCCQQEVIPLTIKANF